MARLRYNGLTATLAADLLTASGTITFAAPLESAAGAVPTLDTGERLALTILDPFGSVAEVVNLTAYTAGAMTGTVERAQEGTTATDHLTGATVLHAPTRSDFQARGINAQTGTTYTLRLSDAGNFVTMTNAAASTLTVPPNSSVAFPVGTVVEGARLGAGSVAITAGSGVTVNAVPGLNVEQYGTFGLIKIDTDTWLAMGRLAA